MLDSSDKTESIYYLSVYHNNLSIVTATCLVVLSVIFLRVRLAVL